MGRVAIYLGVSTSSNEILRMVTYRARAIGRRFARNIGSGLRCVNDRNILHQWCSGPVGQLAGATRMIRGSVRETRWRWIPERRQSFLLGGEREGRVLQLAHAPFLCIKGGPLHGENGGHGFFLHGKDRGDRDHRFVEAGSALPPATETQQECGRKQHEQNGKPPDNRAHNYTS